MITKQCPICHNQTKHKLSDPIKCLICGYNEKEQPPKGKAFFYEWKCPTCKRTITHIQKEGAK